MYETDLLLLICFALLFVYLKGLFHDFLKYQKLFTNIKGPKTLPLSVLAYLFTARSEADRFQILHNLSKRYPNFYSLWFGSKYLFVTDDPSIAQKLLTYPECVEKNIFMEFFGFPNGLISIKSDKWKNERKLLSSSFSLPILQSYTPVFNKCIVQSLDFFRQKCDMGEFDIKLDLKLVVMTATLATTFGKAISREVAGAMMENIENLLSVVWKRSMNPLLYNDTIYSLTSLKKKESQHRQLIFDYIWKEWQELLEKSAKHPEVLNESFFIHQLMKVSRNGRNYSRDEVNDHIGTMLVAAGDTTSTAVNFIFLMLAMHENVQQRIIEEINEVLGENKDLIIDNEKLSELKYVEMVIKETLRLFSPATGLFREVKAEAELGNVGMGVENLVLPQGTNLVINIHQMHRKKEIWGENAENFDPEHFLPEQMSQRHNYCFLPFANGIRHCIAHYVRNFHFSTPLKYKEIKVKAGITLKMIGPHLVRISERK